jgi:hypothetical protein
VGFLVPLVILVVGVVAWAAGVEVVGRVPLGLDLLEMVAL